MSRIEELKCPPLLVLHYTPVSCRIQRWILEHALLLVPACALVLHSKSSLWKLMLWLSKPCWQYWVLQLLGCVFTLLKLRRRYHLSVKAEHIYNEVCNIVFFPWKIYPVTLFTFSVNLVLAILFEYARIHLL